VINNVRKGSLAKEKRHAFDWLIERREWKDETEQEVESILVFCGLEEKKEIKANELSHGQQRRLGIAIALVAKPQILLLDEPFTGMTGGEKDQLMQVIRSIRENGVTLVLVEHDMRAVMRLCDRITVLNFGKVLAEGDPDHVRQHPEVVAAYLGVNENA
jgi:branched-chain amino acid transport system ATP-binding protein